MSGQELDFSLIQDLEAPIGDDAEYSQLGAGLKSWPVPFFYFDFRHFEVSAVMVDAMVGQCGAERSFSWALCLLVPVLGLVPDLELELLMVLELMMVLQLMMDLEQIPVQVPEKFLVTAAVFAEEPSLGPETVALPELVVGLDPVFVGNLVARKEVAVE